jgi:hypothetical protein
MHLWLGKGRFCCGWYGSYRWISLSKYRVVRAPRIPSWGGDCVSSRSVCPVPLYTQSFQDTLEAMKESLRVSRIFSY